MLKLSKATLILLLLTFIGFSPVLAQHGNEDNHEQSQDSHGTKEFDAGKFVIEHVSDSYDWHIVSFGEKHISIPLPIILYSKNPELHDGKSFHVFMSSKFHHGHSAYKGFQISHSKEFEGKIVELDSHGHEIGKPIDISLTKTIAGLLVSVIVLFWLVFSVASAAKRNKGKAPTGVQNLLEPLIIFIRDEVAKPAIGEKKFEKYMPFLLTVFFFILINNFLGLIPIPPFGSNVTGTLQ